MTLRFNIVNIPVFSTERDSRTFPSTSYSNVLIHFDSPFKARVSKVFPYNLLVRFHIFPTLKTFRPFIFLLYVSALTTLAGLWQWISCWCVIQILGQSYTFWFSIFFWSLCYQIFQTCRLIVPCHQESTHKTHIKGGKNVVLCVLGC
jgi:hypothetical protein